MSVNTAKKIDQKQNLLPELDSLKSELKDLDLASVIPPDEHQDKKDNKTDAERIIELAAQGKIDLKTQKAVTETLKNADKMKGKGYQYFMRALAKNKFSRRGKTSVGFLDALSRGGQSAEEATEMLRELAESAQGPISEPKEKGMLKRLNEISEQELKEEAQKSTGAKATSILTQSEQTSKLEKVLKLEINNLKIPGMPKEVVDKLDEYGIEEYRLVKQANPKYVELDALEDQEEKTKDPNIKAKLKRQIDILKQEVAAIDKQIEALRIEAKDWVDKQTKYFKNVVKLFRSDDLVENEVGIKPSKTQNLAYWENDKEGTLTIEEVTFETVESKDTGEKDEEGVDVMVKYKDEKGKESRDNILVFQQLLKNTKAENTDVELEEFEGLAEGQTYTAEVLEDIDKKATRQFKVESVSKDERGDPQIKLDIKKEAITLGAFQKLVNTKKYQRDVPTDEVQTVLDKSAQKRADKYNERIDEGSERIQKYFTPATPDAPKIPKNGGSSDVVVRENGRPKKAKLKVATDPKTGEDVYETWRKGEKTGTYNKRQFLAKAENEDLMGAPQNQEDMADAAMDAFKPSSGSFENIKLPELEAPDSTKTPPEALAYDEVYKAGNLSEDEKGALQEVWMNTRFLSIDDLWEMGKAMYEYYTRRFERRQKEKYSTIGQELPFFSPEMRRINQASENEQVNQFKESFEQKGVYEIQARLKQTHNKDEMKAAFIVLTDKGQMRWDDLSMWKNMNRFLTDEFSIKIPENGDPYTLMFENDDRNAMSQLKGAIDSIWGEGTYNDWYSKNKSTFQSNAKGYYEEGKELENLEGGHGRKLALLLREHKEGRYVDPHEYEGLILHAIEAGKGSMQSKVYYMIQGVAFENKFGRTILSMDRLAHINSEMLVRFPILEYLCASVSRKGGLSHRFTKDDYQEWLTVFDDGNSMNCKPTQKVHEFLWKYVIPSEETQNRINKALRDGERIDHDDMYAYLPPATEQVLTDACKSTTGSKKFVTVEGYANAFPGFSQYFKTLAGNNNKKKLTEGIKSYVRYAGIMTNRFEKGKDSYQRMDDSTLNSSTIVSSEPPQQFMDELDALVKSIAVAYGDSDLTEMLDLIYSKTGNMGDQSEKKKQQNIDYAFQEFGRKFHEVIAVDGGQRMIDIVGGTKLTGMQFTTDKEKDERRAQRKKTTGEVE